MSSTAFLLPFSHQLSLIFSNFSCMFLNPNNFFRNIAGVLSIQAYYYDKNSFKVAFCHVQNPGLDSKKNTICLFSILFLCLLVSSCDCKLCSVYKRLSEGLKIQGTTISDACSTEDSAFLRSTAFL